MVQLRVKNFGPIHSGTLKPSRLTILIGPNNSGKSVLSTLHYALRVAAPSSRHGLSRTPVRFFRPFQQKELSDGAALEQAIELREYVGQQRSWASLPRPDALCKVLGRDIDYALTSYAHEVIGEIERCFSAKLEDLRHRGRGRPRNFELVITEQAPKWEITISFRSGKPQIRLKHKLDPWKLISGIDRASLTQFGPRSEPWQLLVFLSGIITGQLFHSLGTDTYYLPAARSGILQGHKGLASFMVSRASLVGLEDLQIPKLSGVVTDFIRDLLELDPKSHQGSFADIARFLEINALGGEIALEGAAPSYPEISYKRGSSAFPLHQTSSMISELAPMVLMLRDVLTAGEWLVIEEPEAHLHPNSQLILARGMVRAVNEGLNIVATTHSDFLLTQINNCIRGGTALQRGRAPVLDAQEALDPRLVSAYRFAGTADGTVVKPIRIQHEEGITDAEFARVGEDLYSQTIRLYDELAQPDVDSSAG